MKLTKEQEDILQSKGDLKINAIAGSGKTTTIIAYAKSRPQNSKILYLAFNKSVKTEAIRKFASQGINNVKVETAHSLAFKNIVFKNNYKVRSLSYTTNDIASILQLQLSGEKYIELIVANHINKFVAYFCNSDKRKVQDLNYLDTITDKKARTFVGTFYKIIEMGTRNFLAKMHKNEIEITHDFYLKQFQLSDPFLNYDHILFDEGQDASAAMLDIFLRQSAIKVIVGDTHQQIYSWRFAVNSLEQTPYETLHLSTSFRFDQAIANLAGEVLQWKKQLNKNFTAPLITGAGKVGSIKTKAVIARTNLGLLLKAIEYVTEKKELNSIYFEGNIHSYTYADDGASLYDVLNLYNGKRSMIKDGLIKQMKDIDELEEYIEKAEDVQLKMMVEIVKEYGNEIPGILKKIKEKHVGDQEKENASIIFSTVHRSKGMEYDEVQLVNDFISEKKLKRLIADVEEEKSQDAKLNEEINLLYVAITRAKSKLNIPEELMPENFPVFSQIRILKPVGKPIATPNFVARKQYYAKEPGAKYDIDPIRKEKTGAGRAWTEELDERLKYQFKKGMKIPIIARGMGRSNGAILSRIKKLGIEVKEIKRK